MSTTPVTDALDAQGRLEPGQEGWWQVWGARIQDIQAGDLVMIKNGDPAEVREYTVTEKFPVIGIADQCAPMFKTAEAGVRRFGLLCPVVVLRRGTHHMLADSVR